MKKLGKGLFYLGVFIVLLLVVGISLTIGWRPIIGPKTRALTDRKFEATPERLSRGKEMVNLAGCGSCHSARDWTQHGAPVLPGAEMSGQIFPLPDLPGRVVSSNLTPDAETGSGAWTDDQLARSIREGIGHDGRTIFPIMPYSEYRIMSDEDLASVVVYLRTLPPVKNVLPPTEVKFPVNYLVRSAPEPVTGPVSAPDKSDLVKRGKYLATIGCGCHNPTVQGKKIDGLEWGGGEVLTGPWGSVTSQNITPDASGINYYDEATFLKAVRLGYVGARKLNSIMPFGEYKDASEEDLKAIYAYLKTVPAVKHHVDNSLPPTYCKLCKQKHGGGELN